MLKTFFERKLIGNWSNTPSSAKDFLAFERALLATHTHFILYQSHALKILLSYICYILLNVKCKMCRVHDVLRCTTRLIKTVWFCRAQRKSSTFTCVINSQANFGAKEVQWNNYVYILWCIAAVPPVVECV